MQVERDLHEESAKRRRDGSHESHCVFACGCLQCLQNKLDSRLNNLSVRKTCGEFQAVCLHFFKSEEHICKKANYICKKAIIIDYILYYTIYCIVLNCIIFDCIAWYGVLFYLVMFYSVAWGSSWGAEVISKKKVWWTIRDNINMFSLISLFNTHGDILI